MRYPASEKLEIIRLVEHSHLPARRTLEKLGIPRATFHRWYDRLLEGGVDALQDRRPQPKWVWNCESASNCDPLRNHNKLLIHVANQVLGWGHDCTPIVTPRICMLLLGIQRISLPEG
jgi:Helix-turn-helix domain